MRFYLPAVLLFSLVLTACKPPSFLDSTSDSITKKTRTVAAQTLDTQKETVSLIREIAAPWPGPHTPIRTGPTTSEIPKALHKYVEITIVEPVSMREVARLFSEHSGVQVLVAEDIKSESLSDLVWSGSTLNALDHITDKLGFSWRPTPRGIEIYHMEYGFWTLITPSVTTQWQASVGLSGSVQSAGGGSDLQAQDRVVIEMDTSKFWDQIESLVGTLMSSSGNLTIHRQTGELVVRDTPAALQRINRWVQAKNDELSAQVHILVELYEIDDNNNSNAGFNLAGILKEVADKSGFAFEVGTDDEGEAYGLRLIHNPAGTIDASDLLIVIRRAAGGGQVAKLTSTILRGINGMPVPVFFGDETSYLKRREVVREEGSTSVRLIAGQLQDGIAMNMVPKILPDSDRLLLNLTVRTSRIKSISRFPADAGPSDPVIQLPDVESRSMLLPVILRSGDTFLVAGFDTQRSNQTQSKGLLSSSRKKANRQSRLVMFITPTIVRSSIVSERAKKEFKS